MTDEHRIPQTQFSPDLDNIVCVPSKRRILRLVVSFQIRRAGADVIEQDGPEPIFEGRLYEPPHVLIATEAMGKHYGSLARPSNMDVISFDYAHDTRSKYAITRSTLTPFFFCPPDERQRLNPDEDWNNI
jgi:hypothetical protein